MIGAEDRRDQQPDDAAAWVDAAWLASLVIDDPEVAATLRNAVNRFLAGDDGIDAAQRIEGLIATNCAPEHAAHEIADMLAQYRPGGESGYFDKKRVIPPLRTLLRALEPKP